MSKQFKQRLEAFAREIDGQIERSDAIHQGQQQAGAFREVAAKSTAQLRDSGDLKPSEKEVASYRFSLPEFVATTKLNIPRNPANGQSSPIEVLQNGRPVSRIQPSTTYDINVRVRNDGDLFVPAAVCELFRQPDVKKPDVEFETESLSFFLRIGFMTGTLKRGTLSYGDHVRWIHQDKEYFFRVIGFTILEEKSGGNSGTRSLGNNHTTLLERGHTRYKIALQTGDLRPDLKLLPDAKGVLHDAPDYQPEARVFRLRVEDTFHITGRGTVFTGPAEQGVMPTGKTAYRIFTNKIPGERRRANLMSEMMTATDNGRGIAVLSPKNLSQRFQRGDLILPVDMPDFTPTVVDLKPEERDPELPVFLTHQSFPINGHEAKTVRLRVTTSAAGSDEWNGEENKYIARVYSVHPYDMPADVSVFDPSLERRVGEVRFMR